MQHDASMEPSPNRDIKEQFNIQMEKQQLKIYPCFGEVIPWMGSHSNSFLQGMHTYDTVD